MIPHTNWHANADAALVVEHDRPGVLGGWQDHDRKCDTCGGSGVPPHELDIVRCPDCDGTGRHTFDIEVEREWGALEPRPPLAIPISTPTVHVVDVLPIVNNGLDLVRNYEKGCVLEAQHKDTQETMHLYVKLGVPVDDIALPPAAEPGMFLVRLAVHS